LNSKWAAAALDSFMLSSAVEGFYLGRTRAARETGGGGGGG